MLFTLGIDALLMLAIHGKTTLKIIVIPCIFWKTLGKKNSWLKVNSENTLYKITFSIDSKKKNYSVKLPYL